jgi:hypothetical protein
MAARKGAWGAEEAQLERPRKAYRPQLGEASSRATGHGKSAAYPDGPRRRTPDYRMDNRLYPGAAECGLWTPQGRPSALPSRRFYNPWIGFGPVYDH